MANLKGNSSPYDLQIAGRPFSLAEQFDPHGNPTGTLMFNQTRMKFQPLAPSPEGEGFNLTPNWEIPQVFSTWRNGIGNREQPDTSAKDANGIVVGRYIDKLGTYLGPSAQVTTTTPVTTDTLWGGNQFTEFPVLVAAPSAPALAAAGTDGTLTAGNYQVKITYCGVNGETAASGATTQAISGTQHLTITAPAKPAAPFSALGWYAYVTVSGGSTFFLQQPAGQHLEFGVNLTLTTNPSTTGATAPASGTYRQPVLIAAAGRYLKYRQDDSHWLDVTDLGAGIRITGLAVYRGQQAAPQLYIACYSSLQVLQTYAIWDGASLSGNINADADGTKAMDFSVIHDSMWVLNQDSNGRWQIQQTTAGNGAGGTTAGWGGGFVVADGSYFVRHLGQNQDRLFQRGTNGLGASNLQDNDVQIITGDTFKTQYQNMNECRPIAFGQYLITQIASTWFSYDVTSGNINEIGLGTLRDNDINIATGVHTAAAPYRDWTIYTWSFNRISVSSLSAPTIPAVTPANTGGSIKSGNYQAVITYVDNNNHESLSSPVQTATIGGADTGTLTITSPATLSTNAVGWYAYVSQPGLTTLTRIQAAGSPTALGADLTISTTPTTVGACAPKAYLWRWGENDEIDTVYSPVPFKELLPMMYGSLYEQWNPVNGMIVSEIGGLTPRLYWIDSQDHISFMALPTYNSNSEADPNVPYATSWPESNKPEVYIPAITARNAAINKVGVGLGVVSKNASATNFWTALYRTDQVSTFASSTGLDNGGEFTSSPGQRNDWIAAAEPTGNWFELMLQCTNSSATAAPLLRQVVMWQLIRPVMKWVYSATVKVGHQTVTSNGSIRSRTFNVRDDRTFLENLAGATGSVSLTTPDGASIQVVITDLSFEITRREPLAEPEWYAKIEMSEHRPVTQYGTYQRMTPFTYGFLSNYNYAQLEKF